jgi:hypothetical protein
MRYTTGVRDGVPGVLGDLRQLHETLRIEASTMVMSW